MLESKHGIFFPQCKLNEYWPSICCHMRLTSHRDFVWRSWPFQQPSENPPIIIIECTRSTGQTNTRYNPRGLWLRDVGGTSSETVRPVSQTHNGLNWNRKIASGGTIRGEQKSNNQKKNKRIASRDKRESVPAHGNDKTGGGSQSAFITAGSQVVRLEASDSILFSLVLRLLLRFFLIAQWIRILMLSA